MDKVARKHIGVDVSKNHLDICFHETQKTLRINNTDKAIIKFVRSLKNIDIAKIVYEATGGYENLLTQVLANNNLRPMIVNPNRIRAYARAKNVRAKTDKIDAKMIAAFAASECCDDNYTGLTSEDVKLR